MGLPRTRLFLDKGLRTQILVYTIPPRLLAGVLLFKVISYCSSNVGKVGRWDGRSELRFYYVTSWKGWMRVDFWTRKYASISNLSLELQNVPIWYQVAGTPIGYRSMSCGTHAVRWPGSLHNCRWSWLFDCILRAHTKELPSLDLVLVVLII